MGTRSSIAVKHGDKVKAVYCHWDGYLSHNGYILNKHYNSTKANFLVALGAISSLGADIGEKHDFDGPKEDYPDSLTKTSYTTVTTFYGRDRGEKNTSWKVYNSVEEWLSEGEEEYNYLMDDGVWYVAYDSRGLVPLHEALESLEVEGAE